MHKDFRILDRTDMCYIFTPSKFSNAFISLHRDVPYLVHIASHSNHCNQMSRQQELFFFCPPSFQPLIMLMMMMMNYRYKVKLCYDIRIYYLRFNRDNFAIYLINSKIKAIHLICSTFIVKNCLSIQCSLKRKSLSINLEFNVFV